MSNVSFNRFRFSLGNSRVAFMMSVRYLLSLRQVEEYLHGRGIDVSHDIIRAW
jgi:putative transposase